MFFFDPIYVFIKMSTRDSTFKVHPGRIFFFIFLLVKQTKKRIGYYFVHN